MRLLHAENLLHEYDMRAGVHFTSEKFTVINDVSLSIYSGETVALLGRSGCGKSTLARLLVGLEKPVSGQVWFKDKNLQNLNRRARRQLYRTIQMVFQDPVSAVNPRLKIGEIIAEPLKGLTNSPSQQLKQRVLELLKSVQLDESVYSKYPEQVSGGQLQRVCIARALGPRPELIILDESVPSLDLHLQTQMLDLFNKLQQEQGIAYLFVTHDLRLVERFCDRVLVMENGKIVEQTAVQKPLVLSSTEGQALANAVLAPFPENLKQFPIAS